MLHLKNPRNATHTKIKKFTRNCVCLRPANWMTLHFIAFLMIFLFSPDKWQNNTKNVFHLTLVCVVWIHKNYQPIYYFMHQHFLPLAEGSLSSYFRKFFVLINYFEIWFSGSWVEGYYIGSFSSEIFRTDDLPFSCPKSPGNERAQSKWLLYWFILVSLTQLTPLTLIVEAMCTETVKVLKCSHYHAFLVKEHHMWTTRLERN